VCAKTFVSRKRDGSLVVVVVVVVLYFRSLKLSVHSWFAVCGDACPLHVSMLRPASQAGPMHESAGVGKIVNAALLSLIIEACVNICCDTLLSSELVGPVCVQARSSNPRDRACKPNGKGSGEEGILSDCTRLYCPAFSASVSLGVYSRLSGACGQGL